MRSWSGSWGESAEGREGLLGLRPALVLAHVRETGDANPLLKVPEVVEAVDDRVEVGFEDHAIQSDRHMGVFGRFEAVK